MAAADAKPGLGDLRGNRIAGEAAPDGGHDGD